MEESAKTVYWGNARVAGAFSLFLNIGSSASKTTLEKYYYWHSWQKLKNSTTRVIPDVGYCYSALWFVFCIVFSISSFTIDSTFLFSFLFSLMFLSFYCVKTAHFLAELAALLLLKSVRRY